MPTVTSTIKSAGGGPPAGPVTLFGRGSNFGHPDFAAGDDAFFYSIAGVTIGFSVNGTRPAVFGQNTTGGNLNINLSMRIDQLPGYIEGKWHAFRYRVENGAGISGPQIYQLRSGSSSAINAGTNLASNSVNLNVDSNLIFTQVPNPGRTQVYNNNITSNGNFYYITDFEIIQYNSEPLVPTNTMTIGQSGSLTEYGFKSVTYGALSPTTVLGQICSNVGSLQAGGSNNINFGAWPAGGARIDMRYGRNGIVEGIVEWQQIFSGTGAQVAPQDDVWRDWLISVGVGEVVQLQFYNP